MLSVDTAKSYILAVNGKDHSCASETVAQEKRGAVSVKIILAVKLH